LASWKLNVCQPPRPATAGDNRTSYRDTKKPINSPRQLITPWKKLKFKKPPFPQKKVKTSGEKYGYEFFQTVSKKRREKN